MMKHNKHLFAYFGHHKCATLWVNNIISLVCRDTGLKFMNFHDSAMFNYCLKEYIEENDIDFFAYTNAEYRYVSSLDNYRGFHIVRDPRDICVSAYFSHLHSHPTNNWPELEKHKNELKKLSKEDGLLLEMKFRKKEFEDLYNWNYSRPNVIEIKMETLIQSPYQTFLDIFHFIDFLDEADVSIKKQISYLLTSIINKLHRKCGALIPFRFTMKQIPAEILLGKIHDNRFSKKASIASQKF